MESAVLTETAEHENRGTEKKELENAGRNSLGASSPLAAAVAAADVTQTNFVRVVLSAPTG